MKKYKKIIISFVCLAMLVSIFTVSTFAYTYKGESGEEYTIPNEIPAKYLQDIEKVYFNEKYENSDFPIKTSSGNFLTSQGVTIDGNSIINQLYNGYSSESYSNSCQVEIELPNYNSGTYHVTFDMEFEGNDYYCIPRSLLLLKSPDMANFQTIVSFTDEDITRYLDRGYDFTTEKGAKFTFELRFNFDENKLVGLIHDTNGEYITYQNTLTNFPKDKSIVIRYQIQSGYTINCDWSAIRFTNLLVYRPKIHLTDYELSALKEYISNISASEGEIKYTPIIDNLNQDIVNRDSEINNLNETISNLGEDLTEMTDKYETAKEGIENSKAVSVFFQGCSEAVHNFMSDIFGLEVFGFNFGNIVAILLMAFFVIFILKLVF